MDGLRKQYSEVRGKIFKNSLNLIICPHCEKSIMFNKMVATCPYCDHYERYGVERLILGECPTCKREIKQFLCPHPNCRKLILTDADLPETKLFANTGFYTPEPEPLTKLMDTLTEFFENPENKVITDFIESKLFNYIKNLLHDFDMKSERNATEKLEEITKRHNLSIDTLTKLADFNLKKAEGTAEHNKADLLKEAVKYYNDLPPLMKVYLISSLFGNSYDKIEDLKFSQELQDELIRIKKEEARKAGIENDFNEWKFNESKK